RQPSLHHRLGLSLDQWLSAHVQAHQLQLGQSHLRPTTLSLAGTTIDVLTAGPIPSDPVQLLSSLQMQHLLAYAEANYDLVIVDAPAILGSADGLQLASMCKGVVMVNRLDRVTQTDLTEAIAALKQVNPIGIVANSHRGGIRPSKPHHGTSGDLPKGGTSAVWNMVQSVQSLLQRDRPQATTQALSSEPETTSPSGTSAITPTDGVSIASPTSLPQAGSPPQEMGQQLRNLAQSYMQIGVMSMHVPQWSKSS
ncbi:MAG: CpsD/CapB family tyrosine-protein kinase, partial [Merismopedia sp. SIO2A8]|nr:CpsD/CapB family tyrosine-protein kinase [Merismopedia sp. SIO2A8]